MENATKALMIAGAILITIIVIAMAIYFFAQFQEFPKAQEEAKEKAQITKFNSEYESYNKQKMYGVDVVTIINKAINNNKRYANFISGKYLKEDNNYYIDVEVKLQSPVISSAIQYNELEDTNGLIDTVSLENQTIRGKVNGKGIEEIFELKTIFDKGRNISLLEFSDTEVFIDKEFESFFSGFETLKIQLSGTEKFDESNYTLVSSGFTEFKRKFFECTGLEYNPETLRVSKISFEEISQKEA